LRSSKVAPLIVEAFIASLKPIETLADGSTPVASGAGFWLVMTGGVVSATRVSAKTTSTQ
jgi:hypothetical protein